MRCKPSRSRTRWLRDVIGGGTITGRNYFPSISKQFRENRETLEAQSRSTGVEDRQPRIKNLTQRAIRERFLFLGRQRRPEMLRYVVFDVSQMFFMRVLF